jgi:hypothetical protein
MIKNGELFHLIVFAVVFVFLFAQSNPNAIASENQFGVLSIVMITEI